MAGKNSGDKSKPAAIGIDVGGTKLLFAVFDQSMPDIVRSEIAAGIKAHATADAKKNLVVTTAALKGRAVATGAAKLAFDSR